ncbi:hypothetical protein J2S49_000676 [Arcanobacterium wilhelmae]|uniref:Uncharacterized protein n=1 Tax=Arcanobacterium wilhelmae TaxID=1803177 RepID=A0ABT9NA58_9ACTO|nr:hypothetical protein [Arcanobacterium wilhelmae]MDP9800600.1 hypothetical protein [Arcanobacterium wilhelmae]
MLYQIVSVLLNVSAAIFAGVQFSKLLKALHTREGDERDSGLYLSSSLLTFSVPFFSPVANNSSSTASLFFVIVAVSTFFSVRARS